MKAVIYLRSSKDRSDVSIDAQRRALKELASKRDLRIVGEYADAVESGKDDDRPAFQKLLQDMRKPDRTWDTVLALDTARIARRRHLALIFEEQECKKRRIRVIYNSIPDSDPITEMLLKSILQAMDEWHSLTSKAKGLAGMKENVNQGWRAGGRAPRGYKLDYTPTGAIRDGIAVTKSKLVLSDDSMLIRAYFQERLKGTPRAKILAKLKVSWPITSLIDMERNALTYAGHTVWNARSEKGTGGKYRPREEWVLQKNTHEGLITEEEAEAILALVGATNRRSRATARTYLLAGLIQSPDGQGWFGDSGYYRLGKGKKLLADNVDKAVLDIVMAKLQDENLAKEILQHYKSVGKKRTSNKELTSLRATIADLDKQAGILADLIPQTTKPQALLRKIEEIEQRRESLEQQLEDVEHEEAISKALRELTVADVKKVLGAIALDHENDSEKLKAVIGQFVEKVTINPVTVEASVTFRINNITGVKMASPRGVELIPPYSVQERFVLPHRRRA